MNALNEISIVSEDGKALDHSAQEFTRLNESLNAALVSLTRALINDARISNSGDF